MSNATLTDCRNSHSIPSATAAVLLLLLAACSTPTPPPVAPRSAPVAPTNTAAKPLFVPYIPGYSTNQEIRLLTPKTLLEEYSFPTSTCRQTFTVFADGDMTWDVSFPPSIASHGAFIFKRSNDLAAVRATALLRLRIRPGTAAPRVRVGLVDTAGVLTDLPMAAPSLAADANWRLVEIPLASFPNRGISTADPANLATFDWSAVREFRLISDGRIPEPVTVGMLRIWKGSNP